MEERQNPCIPIPRAWLAECQDRINAEIESRMRNLLIYGTTHPEAYLANAEIDEAIMAAARGEAEDESSQANEAETTGLTVAKLREARRIFEEREIETFVFRGELPPLNLAPGGINLIPNPGFEEGIEAWGTSIVPATLADARQINSRDESSQAREPYDPDMPGMTVEEMSAWLDKEEKWLSER